MTRSGSAVFQSNTVILHHHPDYHYHHQHHRRRRTGTKLTALRPVRLICMLALKKGNQILPACMIINVRQEFFRNFLLIKGFPIHNLLESQAPFRKKSTATATREQQIAQ